MSINLTPRLSAAASLVRGGGIIADIGTDHGYLGIWLLQQGIARSVIAADIVPGPLSAAKANAGGNATGTAYTAAKYLGRFD